MSEIEKQGDQATARPDGDIVASACQAFSQALKSLVSDGVRQLTVDFCHVEMIDSLGLGVLVDLYNTLKKEGGTLVVTGVSREVFHLFKIMRLDKHFEVKERAA